MPVPPEKGNEDDVHQMAIQLRTSLCLTDPRDVHCRWQPSSRQLFQAKAWDMFVIWEKAWAKSGGDGVCTWCELLLEQHSGSSQLWLKAAAVCPAKASTCQATVKRAASGTDTTKERSHQDIFCRACLQQHPSCHMGREKCWTYGILPYFSDLWGNFLSCKLSWDLNDPFEGHLFP